MGYSVTLGNQETGFTYNYGQAGYWDKLFGKHLNYVFFGMTAKKSIPLLVEAISRLEGWEGAGDGDGWKATDGNIKIFLNEMLNMAMTGHGNRKWKIY